MERYRPTPPMTESGAKQEPSMGVITPLFPEGRPSLEIVQAPEQEYDIGIYSNRLPVELIQEDDGTWTYKITVGGLATALRQSSGAGNENGQNKKILWKGRMREGEPEGYQTALSNAAQTEPFDYAGVEVPDDMFKDYYEHIANEVLWPLFHSRPDVVSFDFNDTDDRERFEHAWKNYEAVNKIFATEAIKSSGEKTRNDVHDYHLLLMGQHMRDAGHTGHLDFFLHIPFPEPDVFAKMPHAAQIAQALFAYDVVGFQTEKDRDNFLAFAQQHMPLVDVAESSDNHRIVATQERRAKIAAFPISLDPEEFSRVAQREHVIEKAHEIKDKYAGRYMIYSGGRLDYTKGYVESLQAYQNLLRHDPDIRHLVTFVLATPLSREGIPAYKAYRDETERLIAEIQNEFGQEVLDHLGPQDQESMVAHYLAADTVLVASDKDGMNLVAKEAVVAAATKPEDDVMPVLLLSKGTGAADELTDAIQFASSPIDISELEYAMYDALTLPVPDRLERQQANMEKIRQNTIFTWNQRREEAGEQP